VVPDPLRDWKAEEYTKPQGGEFELPPKTVYAVGCVEWQAEQEEKKKAQIEAGAVK
jgi:hypothetical protein